MLVFLALIVVGLWVASVLAVAARMQPDMPETTFLSRLGAVLTRDHVWMRVARSTHSTHHL